MRMRKEITNQELLSCLTFLQSQKLGLGTYAARCRRLLPLDLAPQLDVSLKIHSKVKHVALHVACKVLKVSLPVLSPKRLVVAGFKIFSIHFCFP